MVTEVLPPPKSIRATPFSISMSVRTAFAVVSAVKYFFFEVIPPFMRRLSAFLRSFLFPMKILKCPSSTSLVIPMMSFSMIWKYSPSENDCATAP